jgi:hypothetical protein
MTRRDATKRKESKLSDQISPRAFTYKTLAAHTGRSVRFWRRIVADGGIPFVKPDGKDNATVWILSDDLDRYFAERRQVKGGGASESTGSNQ